MKGIKYANLVKINPIVFELWEAEIGNYIGHVNNTVVCRMSFLAADTRPCVLI